ncbi:flagellar assembly protein FliH [Bordetella sp. 2513F-2]
MSERHPVEPLPLSRHAAWRRWQMASFDEPQAEAPAELPEPEPDPGPDPQVLLQQALEEARARGRDEGYAAGHAQGLAAGREAGHAEGLAAGREAGYAEGLAQARAQGREEAERLHALMQQCAATLRSIEEEIGQGLITLALDVAGQVLRTRLAAHPPAMLDAVREALRVNPSPQGVMRLWVHPEDQELVRLHLADELRQGDWRVLADESITRGGCRVETPYGDVDATLQTRWRRVAASLGRDLDWDAQP